MISFVVGWCIKVLDNYLIHNNVVLIIYKSELKTLDHPPNPGKYIHRKLLKNFS